MDKGKGHITLRRRQLLHIALLLLGADPGSLLFIFAPSIGISWISITVERYL
jgi:hypothetical protein